MTQDRRVVWQKRHAPEPGGNPYAGWIPLLLGILAYVVGYDVWAAKTGREMLTTEVREGLGNHPVWGPAIFGLFNGTWWGLMYHFMFSSYKGQVP